MRDRKTRVAIALPEFAYGGAERMVALLASHIDLDEFEVLVICVNGPARDNVMERMVADHGVRVAHICKAPGISLAAEKRVLDTLRAFKPDVVHTHLDACIFCAPWCLAHRVPMVHTIHNVPDKEVDTELQKRLMRHMYSKREAVPVAISSMNRELTAQFYDLPIDQVEMVVNPVDCGAFRRDPVPASQRRYDCINVARLAAQKNQARLLDAVALLRDRGMAVRLAMVGDGPLQAELEARVVELGLGGQVEFLGLRDDVADLLAQSKLFVLSSDYEGLPMSVLEAMAVGIPVLATEVGGVPDVVADGENGRLVACDAGQLADAMAQMLRDEDALAAMGANGLETARAYDAGEVARRYERLYARCAGC